MTLRKQLLITTAALALTPFAAQAAPISWTGGSSSAWLTPGNWTPAGPPATTSAVTIGNATNNPVQITTGVSLNGAGASLAINSGDSLNVGTGGSLTMGTKVITLNGGTLSSSGTGTVTGPISGFGTLNAQFNGNLTANGGTLDVQHSGSSGSGTINSGATLSLDSGATWTLPNAIVALTNNGTFKLNGGTLQGATGLFNSSGITGSGAFNVTADSTVAGNLAWNSTTPTFNIGGALGAHTLNLDTSTLSTVSGSTPFIIGAGGVLNDKNKASTIGSGGTITLNGGSITNTSGTGSTTAGLFTIGDPISGHGTISGNVALTAGNETVSGGTLVLDGGTGPGVQIGSSGGGQA